MKIAIITDGNNELGMGHIYQSITLAFYLLNKVNENIKIFFITKSNTKIIDILKTTGCNVYSYSNDDLIFESLKKELPDKIIFDKLDVSPILAKKIKDELKSKLIIFTNLTEANRYADITVMAGMGSQFKNIYSKDALTGKVEFWGPKYWLVRQEFYEIKKDALLQKKEVKKILLIFGGSDQANLSSFVVDKLFQINSEFKITIILGAGFQNHTELNEVLSKNKFSKTEVNVIENIKNVAITMRNNDLTCVSPGLSFFESLLVGTPVLCFHQNNFQKEAWAGYIKTYDKEDINELPLLIENKNFIFPTDSFIVKMNIAQGIHEIVAEILN